MKKRTQLWLILALVVFGQATVIGQTSKITLLHNGNSTFFNNMTPALAAAAARDTIYLPGGPISASSPIVIDKLLTIVGAGHYPDSTAATNQTIMPLDIYIVSGADGGSLSGAKCNSIRFGQNPSNQNVNFYRIERCYIEALWSSIDGNSTSQNIYINQCLIANCDNSRKFSSVVFEKSIFFQNIIYNSPALFFNNIFIQSGVYYDYFYANNSEFYNSIFIVITGGTAWGGFGSSNCIFYNNLYSATYGSGITPMNLGQNTVFTNTLQTESTDSTFDSLTTPNFSYSNNYHLKPTSNGHNAGTDGTDVGIYGTQFPAKDGAVPFNPHISYKNIGTSVSPTGTLGVDVKVSAQDR